MRSRLCSRIGMKIVKKTFEPAAALTWCRQQPARRRFISADERLCDAAETAGFVVVASVRKAPKGSPHRSFRG
jgi:hypothetical protein